MNQTKRSASAFLETFLQDLRYGMRVLLKSPVLSFIAILTLGLGIGANTAIFSIVNAVLLRPLPFKDADKLVLAWESNAQRGVDEAPTSLPNALDWKSQNHVFEDMGAWTSFTTTQFNLTGTGEPEQVQYALVSANFFSLLGVAPVYGRAFLAEEDEPGHENVVIVSHSLWERRFSSDPSLIGKPISLDDKNYMVVGILPPDFKFISFPRDAEVWIPLALDASRSRRYVRSIHYLGVIARLKQDVTLEEARTEMNFIAQNLQKEYPDTNASWGIKLSSLHEQVVGNIRPALLILLGAVSFVLLIACANVANLLLARATARQKEVALRAALGAGRGRLIRQLLTESVLLSVIGGGLGLLIAYWGVRFLAAMPFNTSSPYVPYNVPPESIGLDPKVLAFSALLSILTGIIFGLAPALQASNPHLYETLKEGGRRSGSGTRHRFRSLLVVSEVALSLVLLIGAGLLIKSFLHLHDVNPGFNPSNVLTVEISLPRYKYAQDDQAAAFYKQVLERFQTLPNVQSAAAITALPLSNVDESTIFYIEGQPLSTPGQMPQVHHRITTPAYFSTMGISLLKGREFTEQDTKAAPRVIIINETMARRFWPNEDPIGKRVALGTEAFSGGQMDLASGWREIVGVVADVRHFKLETNPFPEAYVTYLQLPSRNMTAVIHTSSDPTNLLGAVRREVKAIDKDQALSNIRTMQDVVSDSVARPRSNLMLLVALAAVALILAVVGVYGVMAYSVTQRTHEIGIRMALGAQGRDVVTMVLKEGLNLALVGVVIGMAGAWAFTRFLSSMLFGVSTTDMTTFALTPLLLVVVVLVACYIPARKAMRVDPLIALRYE